MSSWQAPCPLRDAAALTGFLGDAGDIDGPPSLGCFTTVYEHVWPIVAVLPRDGNQN